MLIAVIVLAVVAIGLLALYLTTKSAAADFRTQSEQRRAELTRERDQLSEGKAGVEAELEAAREEHERKAAEQDAKLAESAEESRRLGAELETVTAESAGRQARIDAQDEMIATLTADAAALRARTEEAEAAAAAANARNAGILVGDVVDLGASQPQTLWDLEVKRSERTWRTSVAPNPDADVTPFDDADDPVKVAVEIEAAALRENVGAFITIDWQAEPIEDPARRHLVVRVAQELLEAAARSPEASRLVVSQVPAPVPTEAGTSDDDEGATPEPSDQESEIKLRLEPVDDDEVINIIPPRITSDLIDVRDETTVVVTAGPTPSAPATPGD